MNNSICIDYLLEKLAYNEEINWLFDVDDTLLSLADHWIELYNLENNDNLKKSMIRTWDIGSYTKIGAGMYDYLSEPDLYENIQPLEYALGAVNLVRGLPNSKIIYCTHVIGHAGQKYNRLKELGFIQKEDSYFEGFSEKSVDKNVFKSNICIDDNFHHISRYNGELPILFTQPWNEDFEYANRLNNWKELIDILEEL